MDNTGEKIYEQYVKLAFRLMVAELVIVTIAVVVAVFCAALCLSGTPACDIARALNRSEKECRRRAKELGTAMPPKPKPYSPSFTSDEEFLPGREDFADDLTEVLHVDA